MNTWPLGLQVQGAPWASKQDWPKFKDNVTELCDMQEIFRAVITEAKRSWRATRLQVACYFVKMPCAGADCIGLYEGGGVNISLIIAQLLMPKDTTPAWGTSFGILVADHYSMTGPQSSSGTVVTL